MGVRARHLSFLKLFDFLSVLVDIMHVQIITDVNDQVFGLQFFILRLLQILGLTDQNILDLDVGDCPEI